jgi:hypothetical protein
MATRSVGGDAVCPRCGSTGENIRPGFTTRARTCRWCVWVLHQQAMVHELERLLDAARRRLWEVGEPESPYVDDDGIDFPAPRVPPLTEAERELLRDDEAAL